MDRRRILVYLPSPLGDAVLCTPALRAIRRKYEDAAICFLASRTVKEILTPSAFNDEWIEYNSNLLRFSAILRKQKFTDAVLFKNSFGAALTALLAGIKNRIGYRRDGRGLLLTHKINPLRDRNRKFTVVSMVDYYLKIAGVLQCDTTNKNLELSVNKSDVFSAIEKLPEISDSNGPIVVLVPGGAFGPSKCWPPERFAETAKELKEKYNATILVSVAPVETEVKIAQKICSLAGDRTYTLAGRQIELRELKAIFSKADLVITNDTGPRHIAIALGKKVVSLFGPNDPKWTDTGYNNEILIAGRGPCVPCSKPECFQEKHICMESISVEMVMSSVNDLMGRE